MLYCYQHAAQTREVTCQVQEEVGNRDLVRMVEDFMPQTIKKVRSEALLLHPDRKEEQPLGAPQSGPKGRARDSVCSQDGRIPFDCTCWTGRQLSCAIV